MDNKTAEGILVHQLIIAVESLQNSDNTVLETREHCAAAIEIADALKTVLAAISARGHAKR